MNATTIAARIKLARGMAGIKTQVELLKLIPEWKPSRLGNYEAGISTPGPEDIKQIAAATQTSPCWLMFGDGPIRPNERDLQAIRHQNLTHTVEQLKNKRGALARLAKAMGISKPTLEAHIGNPFLKINNRAASGFEKHLKLPTQWMDEQHIENDPLCQSFPDDIKEVITLLSGLPKAQRRMLLSVIRSIVDACSS